MSYVDGKVIFLGGKCFKIIKLVVIGNWSFVDFCFLYIFLENKIWFFIIYKKIIEILFVI